MLCYIPLLGEKFTYMDKFSIKEFDEFAQFTFQKVMELGKYMEEHHCQNGLVMDCLALAVAFLLTPPKGTEKIFADRFREKILQTLNKMEELQTALGLKEN